MPAPARLAATWWWWLAPIQHQKPFKRSQNRLVDATDRHFCWRTGGTRHQSEGSKIHDELQAPFFGFEERRPKIERPPTRTKCWSGWRISEQTAAPCELKHKTELSQVSLDKEKNDHVEQSITTFSPSWQVGVGHIQQANRIPWLCDYRRGKIWRLSVNQHQYFYFYFLSHIMWRNYCCYQSD